MNEHMMLLPILVPVVAGLICLLIPRWLKKGVELITVLAAGAALYGAILVFKAPETRLLIPWTSMGIDFDLLSGTLSRFILLAATGFQVLLAVYSSAFMAGKWRSKEFFAYFLITAGFANGAILSNNFVLLLCFWEGLLITLYGMITIGGPASHRTATKAFLISALADFCMILGIIFLWTITGTFTMSETSIVPSGLGTAAFVLMALGAMAKAGAMPFHTWIPDAAEDAPLPFMAYLPAALEKLLGIYMLARIALDFFSITAGGSLSMFLMIIGSITIVLPVMMALIQKDYKRLLSFHAISQVGYMILGIGTCVPVGIAGGIFHMLNHAMYKCTLFLTGGAVEKQAGTTDLRKLGGLFRSMPITGACFVIAALSISGVPPFNGFVSKEMVFHGASLTGYPVFLVAAWFGAIFTFASFLKLGHAVYFGKRSADAPVEKVRETNLLMMIPMLIIAAGCVLFGVYSKLPLEKLVEPVLAGRPVVAGHEMEFWKEAFTFSWIAWVSMGCLVAAFILHLVGVARAHGKAYMSSEIVHNLPVVHRFYDWAEARVFDIYEWFFNGLLKASAKAIYLTIDRGIDALYEKLLIWVGGIAIGGLRLSHTGLYANYLAWIVGGFLILLWFLGFKV